MDKKKINSFTDLIAWKEAHTLAVDTYKTSNEFPAKGFALADQLRRCAISITSNIAEGFSRRTNKDKIQFYYISLGSVTELQNQLLLARDLTFCSPDKFNDLAKRTVTVHKLIFGLIKYARSSHT